MDDPIIHSYTSEDAINDGVLIHPFPKRWPWLLITATVHEKCVGDNDGRTYEQKLVPLLMDCILAVQGRKGKEPPIVLEHTVAGTVWVMPNEMGGMTVMTPRDY